MFVKYRNELFLCNEVRRKNLEKKVVSLQWLLFLGVILMVYLGVWLLGDPGPDGVFKGRGVNDVVGRLMTRTKLGLAMHVGFCQALLCTFIAGIFAHQKIRNEMKSRSENDE
ncbi:hypothetical protein [endosymbiont of Ridgeia piscesae]|jgi:hypothetical protein|uniref:hypothetical protein n=1 Tax=endosymbiont of Ridgeia piscesae TaxID=54398 RepID=UPI001305484C|nr:hypothetical protein [endosymbiont of Ridgeia piscesae]